MEIHRYHNERLMKSFARTIVLACLLIGYAFQAWTQSLEKYGNVVFSPPTDWMRNTGDGHLAFTKINQDSGEFGRIILYQEEKSSGSLDIDFKEDWQSLIVANYQPKELRDFSRTSFSSEWNAIIGVAPYVYQNQNQAVVLVTLSNRKQKISYVFLSNTTAYEKELEDFGSSLEFNSPISSFPEIIPPMPLSRNGTQPTL